MKQKAERVSVCECVCSSKGTALGPKKQAVSDGRPTAGQGTQVRVCVCV